MRRRTSNICRASEENFADDHFIHKRSKEHQAKGYYQSAKSHSTTREPEMAMTAEGTFVVHQTITPCNLPILHRQQIIYSQRKAFISHEFVCISAAVSAELCLGQETYLLFNASVMGI